MARVWRAAALAAPLFLGARPARALRVHEAGGASARDSAIDLDRVLSCLRQTTPSIHLRYPEDAEAHVEEIWRAMRPWDRNYTGSYHVEDIWHMYFADKWFNRTKGERLSDIFGPYIPIFAKWVETWLKNDEHRFAYPKKFLAAINGVLRKDVPYVTLSQSDNGIAGNDEFQLSQWPNILVLSAGGYGHVALPLMQTQGRFLRYALDSFEYRTRYQPQRLPLPQRRYFMSYVGSLTHAPHDLRKGMKATVEEFAQAHHMEDKIIFNRSSSVRDRSWIDTMLSSRFSLVPRGYGRTTYHFAETVQMGLIPIFLYTDEPWIPYEDIYTQFGFVTDLAGLPALLERLRLMDDAEVERREAAAVSFARTHLSLVGVTLRIQSFLTGPPGSSDLTCRRLPASIRDKGSKD